MLPPDQIERLVEKVVEKLRQASDTPASPASRATAYVRGNAPGVFDDLDQAVAAAGRAFEQWGDVELATRARCIAAIRKVCLERVEEIAQKAVAEVASQRSIVVYWK